MTATTFPAFFFSKTTYLRWYPLSWVSNCRAHWGNNSFWNFSNSHLIGKFLDSFAIFPIPLQILKPPFRYSFYLYEIPKFSNRRGKVMLSHKIIDHFLRESLYSRQPHFDSPGSTSDCTSNIYRSNETISWKVTSCVPLLRPEWVGDYVNQRVSRRLTEWVVYVEITTFAVQLARSLEIRSFSQVNLLKRTASNQLGMSQNIFSVSHHYKFVVSK